MHNFEYNLKSYLDTALRALRKYVTYLTQELM